MNSGRAVVKAGADLNALCSLKAFSKKKNKNKTNKLCFNYTFILNVNLWLFVSY